MPELSPVFLTRPQFMQLLEVIGERDFRELVFFAASTGLRLGEILALQWNEVDFSRRLVMFAIRQPLRLRASAIAPYR